MWLKRSIKVYVCEDVLRTLQRECSLATNIETGGILIGYHSPDSITITHATGPGPNALQYAESVELDLDYISTELRRFEKALPVGYEGNWHSHPNARKIVPSYTDEMLLRDVVESGNYDITKTVMIIVPDDPTSIRDVHCFAAEKNRRKYRKLSPILCTNPFTTG
jgi:integrative and conjugative element protein (TIGR02256 family)